MANWTGVCNSNLDSADLKDAFSYQIRGSQRPSFHAGIRTYTTDMAFLHVTFDA
jgi:hypothetical protein